MRKLAELFQVSGPGIAGTGSRRISWPFSWAWLIAGVWAVTFCGIGLSLYFSNRPATSRPVTREITIRSGMSSREVGRLLKREGLIRSASFFVLVAYFSPAGRRVQAGIHDVNAGATTVQILKGLTRARDITKDVTIPEGLSLEEVAAALERNLGTDGRRFLSVATDAGFCRGLGIDANRLEGYLFPETYRFAEHSDERAVARAMVGQFWRVFDRRMKAAAEGLGMSVHQVVTLASIVEREAKMEGERPLIAGVFHRRLKLGMRLEADPTAEYALGTRKVRLNYSDLDVDSPYNTYRYGGLPPGPIANPGRASLQAALFPDDQGYLYFVAKGDGTHVFSRTKGEHDRARARIRRGVGLN